MDSEIGSYQEDSGPERDVPVLAIPSRWARLATTAAVLAPSVALLACGHAPPGDTENIGQVASADTPASVLTQHNDNNRSGANLSETVLTPANVSPQQFGFLYSLPVTGSVYAQPLVASNVTIGGERHRHYPSVVYVATMHNMIYAYDGSASTPNAALLTRQLEAPAPNNDGAGPNGPEDSELGGCAAANHQINIWGEIGILSTPVIVGSTMYVIATTGSGQANHHWLHALDIGTLQDIAPPLEVTFPDGTAFPSYMHIQRPALLAVPQSNGSVLIYAAFASYCDIGPYNGWVLGFTHTPSAEGLGQLTVTSKWNATPSGGAGGIWQSGQGPAADADGDVYFLTGNGACPLQGTGSDPKCAVQAPWADHMAASATGTDLPEAMVELSSDLTLLSWFVPHNYQGLEGYDGDFGAGGVLLLPDILRDKPLALGGGKYSTIYVAEENHLGGFSPDPSCTTPSGCADPGTDPNVVQSLAVNPAVENLYQNLQEIHGSPVSWNGSIYVWATNDNLKAFSFDQTTQQFALTPQTATSASVGNPGGILSISADGAENGIVWASRWLCNCTSVNGATLFAQRRGRLMAFDATDLHQLWDSGSYAAAPAEPTFVGAKNAPPTIANGKVYVSTLSNTPFEEGAPAAVMVYGLMAIPPSGIALSTLSSTGGSLAASQQFGSPQTDVFGIDQNGQLNVAWVTGGGEWNGPAEFTNNDDWPGVLFPAGAPVAVSQQFGTSSPQTDVFAVAADNSLRVAWVAASGAWQGPSQIGTNQVGTPLSFTANAHIAASQQFGYVDQAGNPDQTDVFIVDSSGNLTVTWVTGEATWQSAEITSGGLFPPGAPVAASQQFGLNQTDVFLVEKSGQLDVVYSYYDGPCKPNCGWTLAQVGDLGPGAFPAGAYVAASQQFDVGINQTDVFAVDHTGTLNVGWAVGSGAFSLGPISVGSIPLGAGQFPPGTPIAVSQQFGVDATGQTDVFIVDQFGYLRVMWVEGVNEWNGPALLSTETGGPAPGPFPVGASIAVSQQFGLPPQTDVFVVDRSGNRTVTWVEQASEFNGPSEIPSSIAEDYDAVAAACTAAPCKGQ
jgi:hypothetical protein